MCSLIYWGMLDRYPELRVVISHGGGYLPHYIARLDRNARSYAPDSARKLFGLPSDYLRRFHVDTCVYDPRTLVAVLDRLGPDRVILGSDWPVGDTDHPDFVRRSAELDEDEMACVFGRNAEASRGNAAVWPQLRRPLNLRSGERLGSSRGRKDAPDR
jgi:aminocarboxymuconate-semialdehyde decarboxylase